MNIPKDAQNVLMQLQVYQQQLEQIAMQKQSFSIQMMEMERALEELKNYSGEDVFKNLGPVLIKTSKDDSVKDLSTKVGMLGDALKKVGETEKKLSEAAERAQKKLEEILKEEEKNQKK